MPQPDALSSTAVGRSIKSFFFDKCFKMIPYAARVNSVSRMVEGKALEPSTALP